MNKIAYKLESALNNRDQIKMPRMNQGYGMKLLLAVFVLISMSFCEVYQLPAVTSNQSQYIRLGSIHELSDEPNINLSKIYKRQIYEYISNKSSTDNNKQQLLQQFAACEQSPAEVGFDLIGYYSLLEGYSQADNSESRIQSSNLIYDYEVLKSHYKNVVDMTYYSDHVFTITSTGIISVYRVDERMEQGIKLKAKIQAIDWEKLVRKRVDKMKQALKDNKALNDSIDLPESLKFHHIQKGYFQLMDQNQLMLFSNGQVLIGLDIRTLKATLLSQEKTIQLQSNYGDGPRKVGQQVQQDQDEDEDDSESDDDSDDDSSDSDDDSDQYSDQDSDEDDDSDWEEEEDSQEEQNLSASGSTKQDQVNYYTVPIPNSNYSVKLTRQYEQLQNFESVTKIDQNHFAVLDRKKGVIIYKINTSPQALNQPQLNYEIQKIQTIDKQKFGKIYYINKDMNLIDIKFSKQKRLLLVLDYDHGVFAFDKSQVQIKNGSNHPMFLLNSNMILKKQCNLIEYSPFTQSLYMACDKIYRISLARWPLVSEKTFIHPMINIREIYPLQEQNLLLFAGFSTFKILYLDRQAQYFEDEMLDKILFQGGNKAITANQYAIFAYNYWIDKPVITCQTNNATYLGEHNVVLKTTAECQKNFFKSVNQTNQSKSIFQTEDVCIYTVYKTLYIWEQGQVPEKIIIVIAIVLSLFSVVAILWIIFIAWRSLRAKRYLNSLPTGSHATLVEQTQQKSQSSVPANDINVSEQAETGESINKMGDSLTSDKQPQQKL